MPPDVYRGLADLWKQVYSAGTEAHQFHLFSQSNWNFSNLSDAFREGGLLHETSVYLFSRTEAHQTIFQGQRVPYYIPVVVAIVSPHPPSDKIVIRSRDSEELYDMQEMNMDWLPWDSAVETVESQIFILSRLRRRAGLLNRVNECEYWIPYYNHPFKIDDTEQSTIVNIMYTAGPNSVVCEFDWEMDKLEEFTNEHLPVEEFSESQKDTFKQFVKEKVREGKRANREARERRRMNARERQEAIAAFTEMRFYKFYPVATADTPNISHLKVGFINTYFDQAHQVF